MAEVTDEIVARIAGLARLEVAPEEVHGVAERFRAVLEHFESLAELDVEGVEPMTGPLEPEDVLRDDVPRPSLPVDEALANAPERIDGFYSVPKTVGGRE